MAALQTVIWMRPEHAKAGRPAERSRALVTAAAIKVADRDGLDAVSMRRVAAELGTGAASLYRYIATRDDLLDLMADATGAEYALAAPSGNWLADLVGIAGQARAIMLRHPWLPALVITRATPARTASTWSSTSSTCSQTTPPTRRPNSRPSGS